MLGDWQQMYYIDTMQQYIYQTVQWLLNASYLLETFLFVQIKKNKMNKL